MSSIPRKILRIIVSVVAGFWIGFVAGNLATVASSALGGLAFFVFWIGTAVLLYRHYHRAILVGSAVLAGAVLCLLIPLCFIMYGAGRREAFAGIITLVGSALMAVVLTPIGLALAYVGYRLTTAGIDALKRETAQRPHAAVRVQYPIASGAVFCRSCGARIAPYDAYCPICGQKQPIGP
jgi:hypothetical protein